MQQLPNNTFLQGGKYKIEKVLGQGGFGITYLATQELLERKVCIKEFFFKDSCGRTSTGTVTLGMVGNKDLVERFLNKFIKEARTISKLEHPNIIRILDVFMENGTAYYVMDFIEGQSLEDIVKRRGALPEHEAIGYIKQVANALDYLHQRKINHLDVKPANIMIRKDDNKAILIDFGVSKQYDEQGEQTSTTPVGISYGYAPIEQYRPGGVSEFSPQADIYSLGATLYRLVTGDLPPEATASLNKEIEVPHHISPNIRNMIISAMQTIKANRPKTITCFSCIDEQVSIKREESKDESHESIEREFEEWRNSWKGKAFYAIDNKLERYRDKIDVCVELSTVMTIYGFAIMLLLLFFVSDEVAWWLCFIPFLSSVFMALFKIPDAFCEALAFNENIDPLIMLLMLGVVSLIVTILLVIPKISWIWI